jgi:hypothetical protein
MTFTVARSTRPGHQCRASLRTVRCQGDLKRIGLRVAPDHGPAKIRREHAPAIAFENFYWYSGTPVRLDLTDIEDKIVTRPRGT